MLGAEVIDNQESREPIATPSGFTCLVTESMSLT